ncbi:MAG: hypothetical protein IKS60_06100 [Lachnospiraceae bacterium]|nr:hypothetical protein [Lachnospiraceae bacterium]MBR4413167.1 hypothetical protein [Lachnospiraceae bacterium]MBR5066539.1 hypothetical protein [Lachnospiraceae bacterium]MBR5918163.1 hypothetical protein [Lachnospiraceae bacterium]
MRKNIYRNGSFTIECALIMPMILLCIVSVMWLMIYMYDENVIYRSLVHAVLAADYRESDSNSELKNEIEERVYEDLKGQLVGVSDAEVFVKVGKNSVTAKVEAKLAMSQNLPGLSELGEIKTEVKEKRMSGADIILDVRRIKAIYDIADKIVGSEKDKEEVETEEE